MLASQKLRFQYCKSAISDEISMLRNIFPVRNVVDRIREEGVAARAKKMRKDCVAILGMELTP